MDEETRGIAAISIADYILDRYGRPVLRVDSMPDLIKSPPVAIFECDIYVLVLLENPRTLLRRRTSRPGIISYPFSLAVLNTAMRRLDWFISIEEASLPGTRMLAIFDTSKFTHSVVDEIGPANREEFLEIATRIFREEAGCSANIVKVA